MGSGDGRSDREVIHVRTRVLALCAAALGAAILVVATTTASAASSSLTILGPWSGANAASFQAVLDGFEQANPGVTVTYRPVSGDVAAAITNGGAGGTDLAVLSLPADVTALESMAKAGSVKSLDFALPTLHAHYAYSWQRIGSVGGTLVGLPFKATNDSAVWYDRHAFQVAGITAPRSWFELQRAMKTLAARGIAPFALSGGSVALPNLFENVYLMLDGSQRYDKLAGGQIAWTGSTVRSALERMAQLTTGLAGGPSSLNGGYAQAVQTVFGTPAKAAMVPGGSAALPILYAAKAVRPLSQFGVFAFPTISGDVPRVIGDTDVVVMTKASDTARSLIDYLATPQAATIWAKRGGFFLSPNRGVDPNAYASPAVRSLATSLAAANVFRLSIAATKSTQFEQVFSKMLDAYVVNPASADTLLPQVSKAAAG